MGEMSEHIWASSIHFPPFRSFIFLLHSFINFRIRTNSGMCRTKRHQWLPQSAHRQAQRPTKLPSAISMPHFDCPQSLWFGFLRIPIWPNNRRGTNFGCSWWWHFCSCSHRVSLYYSNCSRSHWSLPHNPKCCKPVHIRQFPTIVGMVVRRWHSHYCSDSLKGIWILMINF